MPNPVKTLHISSATAREAPDLLKALAVLLDATVRISAVDQEDLNHTENLKKDHISVGDQQSYSQAFQRIY